MERTFFICETTSLVAKQMNELKDFQIIKKGYGN